MEHPTDEHFTEIYNSCFQDMFRVSYSYLQSNEDSENVLQDVFVEYFEHPPKDERNIKSWLVFKTIHRSLDVLRKRRSEIEVQEGSACKAEARANEGNEGELEEALSLKAEVNLSSNGSVFYASSFTVTLGSDGEQVSLLIDFGSFVTDYGANGWSKDSDGYSFTASESNHFVGTFDFSFPIDKSDELCSKEIILTRTSAFGINEAGADLTNVCLFLPTSGERASTIPQPSNSNDWHE